VAASTGKITTFAGNGTAGYSATGRGNRRELSYPIGVAVDTAGNVYVADGYNNVVREISALTGNITTVAGRNLAAA